MSEYSDMNYEIPVEDKVPSLEREIEEARKYLESLKAKLKEADKSLLTKFTHGEYPSPQLAAKYPQIVRAYNREYAT